MRLTVVRLATLVVKSIYAAIGLLGVGLLALNIVGVWLPLRNPAIYHEPRNNFHRDITLTEAELRAALIRQSDETNHDYAVRATKAVKAGIAHYWWGEKAEEYNLRVPLHENYILWYLGSLHPYYELYQFVDPDKAIERGIGLCSQHSMILTDALQENGIAAHIVDLSSQHVVVTAHINGQAWVLDPDYGLVLPYDLETLANNPDLIRSYYLYTDDVRPAEQVAEWAIRAYSLPDTTVYPRLTNYTGILGDLERQTYIAIWIIPMFCIGVSVIPFRREVRLARLARNLRLGKPRVLMAR